MPAKKNSSNSNRRRFLAAGAAALAGVLPPLTGLGVLLNPLRKKSNLGQAVRVTSLSALPADGVPRKFPVVTDRIDAWNHFRNVLIGAVYLRRTEENSVEAFSVDCPHAGCFVEYRSAEKNYLCPCHDSRFISVFRIHCVGRWSVQLSPTLLIIITFSTACPQSTLITTLCC